MIRMACVCVFWAALVCQVAEGASCQGTHNVTGTSGGVISDGSGVYESLETCVWTIHADPGDVITLWVNTFDVECGWDMLTIVDGVPGYGGHVLGVLSGVLGDSAGAQSTLVPEGWVAYSGVMTVTFVTDDYVVGEGFELGYLVSGCPFNCHAVGLCDPIHHECYECVQNRHGEYCQYAENESNPPSGQTCAAETLCTCQNTLLTNPALILRAAGPETVSVWTQTLPAACSPLVGANNTLIEYGVTLNACSFCRDANLYGRNTSGAMVPWYLGECTAIVTPAPQHSLNTATVLISVLSIVVILMVAILGLVLSSRQRRQMEALQAWEAQQQTLALSPPIVTINTTVVNPGVFTRVNQFPTVIPAFQYNEDGDVSAAFQFSVLLMPSLTVCPSHPHLTNIMRTVSIGHMKRHQPRPNDAWPDGLRHPELLGAPSSPAAAIEAQPGDEGTPQAPNPDVESSSPGGNSGIQLQDWDRSSSS